MFLADCAECNGGVVWIHCPTGGWWAHDIHPDDNHDARVDGCYTLPDGDCVGSNCMHDITERI